MGNSRFGVLNANHLKMIAAFTMLLDHMGILLFPEVQLFRILGRIAYPIYAFMIAEGCRYTKNKLRYFLMVCGLGAVCQIVYYITSADTRINILLTFSLSILLIYCLQFAHEAQTWQKEILWSAVFAAGVLAVYGLCWKFHVDYGFWGIMTPVLVSFGYIRKFPNWAQVVLLGCGLLLLGTEYTKVQQYALLSLPLLMLYSGKRGKAKMKYFFYIFYPVHLAVLQGIAWIVR